MILENFISNVLSWFRDTSDRNSLIRDFNINARSAFISGIAPALLKASTSRGDSRYKHSFSRLYSGFRVQAMTGTQLSKNELLILGETILEDKALARSLVALGWDTLEIHSDQGSYGCKWRIYEHIMQLDNN